MRHTQKRLLETVYIQHKETEQSFWTGRLHKTFQSDELKQCQHLVLIVVEVMLSAEISLQSFYSFSINCNMILSLQHKGILCSLLQPAHSYHKVIIKKPGMLGER